MAKCSPRYLDENGTIKNPERLWGNANCDYTCIHWNACWEELRGGSHRVLPLMSQEEVNSGGGIIEKKKGKWHG